MLRRKSYNKKRKRFTPTTLPVISIGNLAVGGTGKTPHTEYLIRMLKNSFQVATLSRGYKRKSRGYILADSSDTAELIGDEPMQIKKKFPGVVVAVDKKREQGCDLLVHPEKLRGRKWAKKCWNREFPAANYIILDDAFQYRRLKTNKSVVLVEYNHPR